MKKIFILILLIISLISALSACTPSSSSPRNETSETSNIRSEITSNASNMNSENIDEISTTQTAVITDINLEHSTIMIGESLDTDYESQTRVFIKQYTKIIINGNPSNLESLFIGARIELTYTGGVLESAPSQIVSPLQIEVME